VSREFPLRMHQYSREAANYATAAARLGKYQQVADALFLNQLVWELKRQGVGRGGQRLDAGGSQEGAQSWRKIPRF